MDFVFGSLASSEPSNPKCLDLRKFDVIVELTPEHPITFVPQTSEEVRAVPKFGRVMIYFGVDTTLIIYVIPQL